MLRDDEALREKIYTFMRRKRAKYPELDEPTAKHEAAYSGGYHKAVDTRPYILTDS